MLKFANANIANNINMKFDGTYGEKWCECPYVGKCFLAHFWRENGRGRRTGPKGLGPQKSTKKLSPQG